MLGAIFLLYRLNEMLSYKETSNGQGNICCSSQESPINISLAIFLIAYVNRWLLHL